MSTIIQDIERRQLREVPRFKAGDTVRVHFRVIEGTRQRIQVFEGIVIKRQGAGARETFTVRKNSFGVGVERTFPLHSPKIDKIEVMRSATSTARSSTTCAARSARRLASASSASRNFCANSVLAERDAARSAGLFSARCRPSAARPARSCSGSTAGSAPASSRAPTRRGAGRSPGRSSSPGCCSTTSRLRDHRVRPARAPERLEAGRLRDARGALPRRARLRGARLRARVPAGGDRS